MINREKQRHGNAIICMIIIPVHWLIDIGKNKIIIPISNCDKKTKLIIPNETVWKVLQIINLVLLNSAYERL